MVRVSRINNVKISSLVRDLMTTVELIKARQEEKQAVIEDFESESKRYFFGNISKTTVRSSIRKTKLEIERLEKNIESAFLKTKRIEKQIEKMILPTTRKVEIDSEGKVRITK